MVMMIEKRMKMKMMMMMIILTNSNYHLLLIEFPTDIKHFRVNVMSTKSHFMNNIIVNLLFSLSSMMRDEDYT